MCKKFRDRCREIFECRATKHEEESLNKSTFGTPSIALGHQMHMHDFYQRALLNSHLLPHDKMTKHPEKVPLISKITIFTHLLILLSLREPLEIKIVDTSLSLLLCIVSFSCYCSLSFWSENGMKWTF